MTDYAAIFDETNTFENWSWVYQDGVQNSYGDIGIDVWLFNNAHFTTYKDWLLTGAATDRVDNDPAEAQLNSATLQTFRNKIVDYDGLSMIMFVTHEAFTVA